VTRLRDGQLGFDSRQRQGFFHFATAFRLALGATHPIIQWVPGALSPGESGPVVKLTTYLHLVPRLTVRGDIPRLTHTSSWRGA